VLVDANLLLFAVDEDSPFHASARDWLTDRLNGPRRVGLPWQSLEAFLRITTHPRATPRPLEPEDAWERVADWLACEVTWIPEPGERHADVLGELVVRHRVRGNLVPDARLAALALEHGLTVCSADTDFVRFTEVRWENPVALGLG
jgi:toxin-antitoxin system PIN domain toxin